MKGTARLRGVAGLLLGSAMLLATVLTFWSAAGLLRHSPFVLSSISSQDEGQQANGAPLQRMRHEAEAKARAGTAKVVYLHPQKTAGSTICKLAQASGMASNFSNNCLWRRPTDPVEKQIKDFVSASDWTFMAVEYTHLPLQDRDLPLPGDVVYIVTLRHPLERMLSYYRHVRDTEWLAGEDYKDYTFVKYATTVFDTCDFLRRTQTQNFYAHLLGCCGDDGVQGGCTTASLAKAKRRLDYFSVIMLTDDATTFASTARMLQSRLGWRNVNVNHHRRGTHNSALGGSALLELQRNGPPEDVSTILRSNQLDLELYEYAKGLALSHLMQDITSAAAASTQQLGLATTPADVNVALTTMRVASGHMREEQHHQQHGQQHQHLRRVAYRSDRPLDLDEDFDARRVVADAKDRQFVCQRGVDGEPQAIALVMWHNDLVDPLRTFYHSLGAHTDCPIKTLGLLRAPAEDNVLLEELRGVGLVLWWNWEYPAAKMHEARAAFPEQTWVLMNWDDPWKSFVRDDVYLRKGLFDVAFSSGTAALPGYVHAGAREAHAFVPMIDDSHYYDFDPAFEADVAFVATTLYDYPSVPRNRTAILGAIAADARRTGLKLNIYGTEAVGRNFPEFYKGPIRHEENRKVWSSVKISMNLHIVDGYGGWYANARNTEILGSRGLLVVDRAVEGPLQGGEDCVFWRSNEPQDIVQQIHEILDNYEAVYEPIRARGQELARRLFDPHSYAVRVLAAAARVTGGNSSGMP